MISRFFVISLGIKIVIKLFKGRLVRLFFLLMKISPISVAASLFFKGLFLLAQILSITTIFSWSMGHVRPALVGLTGYPPDSVIYPCLAACCFVASSIFLLISKKVALSATMSLEKLILSHYIPGKKTCLTPGDLNNIVKLMLSLLDSIVPIALIFCVSVAWGYIEPFTVVIVLLIVVFFIWLMRKGVSFSAGRYREVKSSSGIESYYGSERHVRFYKILILPQYISIASTTVVSLALVFSIISAKIYLENHSSLPAKLMLVTGVAFLQSRSFVGIVLRAGAYNKSLVAVTSVLFEDVDREMSG